MLGSHAKDTETLNKLREQLDGDDPAPADLDEEINFDDHPGPDHTSGIEDPQNMAGLDDLVSGFVGGAPHWVPRPPSLWQSAHHSLFLHITHNTGWNTITVLPILPVPHDRFCCGPACWRLGPAGLYLDWE